jgi:phosphatidylglycerophosphate synthase
MWSLPNLLTIARVLAVVPVVWAVLSADWLLAFGLFTAAALTDFFDGWLARRWNQTSAFGRFLDPIADKLMVAAVLVALPAARLWNPALCPGISSISDTELDCVLALPHPSTWASVAILTRELLVSGLRECLGPLNVVVHVSTAAKWKTALQLIALALMLAGPIGSAASLLLPGQEHWVAGAGAALLTISAILAWKTAWDYFRAAWPHMRGQ